MTLSDPLSFLPKTTGIPPLLRTGPSPPPNNHSPRQPPPPDSIPPERTILLQTAPPLGQIRASRENPLYHTCCTFHVLVKEGYIIVTIIQLTNYLMQHNLKKTTAFIKTYLLTVLDAKDINK